MNDRHPERLASSAFMTLASPFRIFYQVLSDPIAVHWHEFYETALVVGGSGLHVLNGKPMRIGKGEMFLLTPADFHEFVPEGAEPLRLYNVIFTERYLRPELLPMLFRHDPKRCVTLDEGIFLGFEAEFLRMWKEAGHPQTGAELIVQGALERVLIDFIRLSGPQEPEVRTASGSGGKAAGREGAGSGGAGGGGGAAGIGKGGPVVWEQASVRRALLHIQHHFREELTLEGVAAHAKLSKNYFSECFAKSVGVTFQSYVAELRLQFARSLLAATPLPVTDICFASGFGSLPHFERAFKRRFGMTPREFRKSV